MEANILVNLLLPIALFIIMIGMGLSLATKDFARILHHPTPVALGLSNQLIGLPILGFFIATVLQLPPVLAVGLMILAACPGGALSNLITHVANGDTALSITLTAFSSFISVLTIPLITSAMLLYFMGTTEQIHLPILPTIGKIIAITIFPISIGMILRHYQAAFAQRTEPFIRRLSIVLYVIIVSLIIVNDYEIILPGLRQIGLAVILFNIAALSLGYYTARLLHFDSRQTIAISVETGIQNCALAVVIASTILQRPDIALVPAIYSLPMFITGGCTMFWFGRYKHYYSFL